ncbi:MAG: aminotransferase class I/II-fold pyridoxal phosphate-dependent enzyme [Candidatus Bipolaricaulia bacterium]
MRSSGRLQDVPPYPFVRWNAACRDAAAEGIDVIRLDMGSPDLPPPVAVTDALCASARRETHHGYPGFRGTPRLREAIATYYARRFDVELDPETQIVPLLGSKEGIVNMALACLDPGDVALVPDPGYAPYARGVQLAGGKPHFFPLVEERAFLPNLQTIPAETARRAAMLWLNYPNNPTGATTDLDFLAEAVAFARTNDLLLCHDAPYADVTFDGYVAPSVLQVPGAADVAVEFNSVSKTFNMAGWRVGMAVGRPDALALLAQIKSNVDSGIFLPIQDAAVRALSVDCDWIAARNGVYRERLSMIVEALNVAGLDAFLPRATLYLWVRLPPGVDSEALALHLLEATGVSVSPGTFFGPAGDGFLRVSATAPTGRIAEASERLRKLPSDWVETMGGSQ